MKEQCDIIILAAGSSSRLGTPKQSLLYKQNSLLQHAVNQALASIAQNIIVVLCANDSAMNESTNNARLTYIINYDWKEGMASSIRFGLNHLLQKKSSPKRVTFMTCDQPFVNPALLDKLVSLQIETRSPITASEYGGTVGIPAVFAASLFPAY